MSRQPRGAPRVMNQPEVGFYKLRLVKGGPLVGARIWRPCSCTVNGGDEQAEHDWRETCDRYPLLRAETNGRPWDPVDLWHRRSEPIAEAEYRFLVDDATHARQWRPGDPKAEPETPIDPLTAPILF